MSSPDRSHSSPAAVAGSARTSRASSPQPVLESETADLLRDALDLLPRPRRHGDTHNGPSKAALYRFGEALAAQVVERGIAVFTISPGLVRTALTEGLGDDAPWTPPSLAPQLVRALASGRADRLTGRYIHAEHDDIDDLIARADEIVANDLNAIRLRRTEV